MYLDGICCDIKSCYAVGYFASCLRTFHFAYTANSRTFTHQHTHHIHTERTSPGRVENRFKTKPSFLCVWWQRLLMMMMTMMMSLPCGTENSLITCGDKCSAVMGIVKWRFRWQWPRHARIGIVPLWCSAYLWGLRNGIFSSCRCWEWNKWTKQKMVLFLLWNNSKRLMGTRQANWREEAAQKLIKETPFRFARTTNSVVHCCQDQNNEYEVASIFIMLKRITAFATETQFPQSTDSSIHPIQHQQFKHLWFIEN